MASALWGSDGTLAYTGIIINDKSKISSGFAMPLIMMDVGFFFKFITLRLVYSGFTFKFFHKKGEG